MGIYDHTTSVLNISNKNLNCNKIINILLKNKIISNVKENKSIICDNNNCWVENGCEITLCGLKPKYIEKKVWNPIKNICDIKCAHLNIKGYYKGCILNFIRKSNCKNT